MLSFVPSARSSLPYTPICDMLGPRTDPPPRRNSRKVRNSEAANAANMNHMKTRPAWISRQRFSVSPEPKAIQPEDLVPCEVNTHGQWPQRQCFGRKLALGSTHVVTAVNSSQFRRQHNCADESEESGQPIQSQRHNGNSYGRYEVYDNTVEESDPRESANKEGEVDGSCGSSSGVHAGCADISDEGSGD